VWLNFDMKVWVATWDVGGTETGFVIFSEESLAVEAAIGYALEMSLFDDESLSTDDARQMLMSAGELNFNERQCCYGVYEHDVMAQSR
jgi:hypothetical protein